MTGYGETVTPKEILKSDPNLKTEELSNTVDNGRLNSVDQHQAKLLEIDEFHYQHENNSEAYYKDEFLLGKDALILYFSLKGDYRFKPLTIKQEIVFNNGEHNMLFLPAQTAISLQSLTADYEVICIYFDLNFILKYIPDNHLLLKFTNTDALVPIVAKNFTLNPKMFNVLEEIIHCSFEGHLKKLFTQAKIIELLTLQLLLLEEEQSSKSNPNTLKESDIEKMTEVKNMITSNLHSTFSLASLARSVGTNEQYLKKNFKILYGKTVFNYLLDFKMEKAKTMLLNSDHKIADIANALGYKHATHFSSAFKKYFGYIPQKLKSKMLSNFLGFQFIFWL